MTNGLSFTEIAQKLAELQVDFFDGTRFLPLSQVMHDLQRTYTRSTTISAVELYEQIAEIANEYSSRDGASAHPRLDEIFPRQEVEELRRRIESIIYDAIQRYTGRAAYVNTTNWWLREPWSADTNWCTTTPIPGVNFPTMDVQVQGTSVTQDVRVQGTSATQYVVRDERILADLENWLYTSDRDGKQTFSRERQRAKAQAETPDWTKLDNFLSGLVITQKGVRAT